MRLIPPVAVPFKAHEVASALVHRGAAAAELFAAMLREATGAERVLLYGSGRAALAHYLRPLGEGEVLVPAYTCWSLPASVVRAGCKLRLVDVDPSTFDMVAHELRAAVSHRTVAVIAAHLLAPTSDVEAVASVVRTAQPAARVIEDAAQAWPQRVTPASDAVLLSFGRGKPLPLGAGGALLCRLSSGNGGPQIASGGWSAALALALTSALGSPRWYRWPEGIPFLGIGATEFDPRFELDAPFRRWQGRLATRLLPRLPALIEARSAHARRLADRLDGTPGWTIPRAARARGPLRLPLLADSRDRRDRMLAALREGGVAASGMYPGSLADIPELRPHLVNADERFAGARALADRLLTLPVYPGLAAADLDAVGAAFERAARGRC
jgi:dTDP-4-amino-4,6-dideoxygalactose transaminase